MATPCGPDQVCDPGFGCGSTGCAGAVCKGDCLVDDLTHTARPMGLEPTWFARDLDGDGHGDLLAVHQLSYDAYVYWGDGTGRLSAPTMTRTGLAQRNTWPLGRNWGGVAIADFDEDGDLDFVTTQPDSDHLQLLRLSGRTYVADAPFTQLDKPRNATEVDANHDGHADLFLYLSGKDCVVVRYGHGNGTFEPATECLFTPEGGVESQPHHSVDWDGDGYLDLVDALQGGTIRVRRSAGDGTFPELVHWDRPSLPYDGVRIYESRTSSRVPSLYTVRKYPIQVYQAGADPSVLAPRCDALGLDLPDLAGLPRPGFPVVHDWDEDDVPDVVVTSDIYESALDVGTSGLLPEPTCPLGECAGQCMPASRRGLFLSTGGALESARIGRLDADAHDDVLLVGPDSVALFRGDGAGAFAAADVVATGGASRYVDLGDVTGDGIADLVLAQPTLDRILILRGTGTSFVFERALAEPEALHVGTFDWNRDGALDLFVWAAERNANAGCVVIRLNPGNGDFAAAGPDCAFDVHDPAYPPLSLESVRVDWDGEGIDEYVDPFSWRGRVRLHTTSVGTGGAVELFRYSGFVTGTVPKPVHVQRLDLDHDGRPELLHRNEGEATARGVYEITEGGFESYCDNLTIPAGIVGSSQQDIAGELDGDGLPDFVFVDPVNGRAEVMFTGR
ncbi:MAG: VCBS repeat-containing protein [Polyangiales bacterium]